MRFLLLFLIVNAFALQKITEVWAKPFNLNPFSILDNFAADEEDAKNIVFDTFKNLFTGQLFKSKSTTQYPPNESDVRFRCTKGDSKLEEVRLNDADVNKKLDFSKPINFLIHGFMADIKWINEMAEVWAKDTDSNVCTVDWRPLAGEFKIDFSRPLNFVNKLMRYPKVSMDSTRLTANAVVRFMKFLEKHGMKIEQVSIAGHSLGAHISGYVGAVFNGKIDAIYGLDPAGPGFELNGKEAKLNQNDARYVQAIYTDGNTFGTKTIRGIGHANFYMNGGDSQIGCKILMCDHTRAHQYFRESITNKFWGFQCNLDSHSKNVNWDTIGIHSERKHGNFYVPTNSKSPYALSQNYIPQDVLLDLSVKNPLEIRKILDKKGL